MNRIHPRFVSLFLLAACLFGSASQVSVFRLQTTAARLQPADEAARARIHEAYGKLPLSFEANRGQAALNFVARTTPAEKIAVDAGGNTYLATTISRAQFLSVAGEKDILVTKFNAAGSRMLYSTVIGGDDEDSLGGMSVDAAGNVHLACNSSSPDFPGAANLDVGAVIKSSDSAASWNSSGRGLISRNLSISDIAIDPAHSNVMYAGSSSERARIFNSADAGGNWTLIGKSLNAPKLLTVVPGNPSVVYAGTADGLMKSSDGGLSWSNAGLNQPGISSLAFDPRNTMNLYAATANAVYKSANGGASWNASGSGLPVALSEIKLLIDPVNPNTVYALLGGESAPRRQIYRSLDGGANWNLRVSFADRYIVSFAVDPINSALYIGADRGMFRSTDGGGTLQPLGLDEIFVLAIVIDPANPATIYASTPFICCGGTPYRVLGGIHKSTNGGASWTRLENSLKDRSVFPLVMDPARPSNLFATGRTGEFRGVFALKLSQDGARPVDSVFVAEGAAKAIATDASGDFYVAGYGKPEAIRNGFQTTSGGGYRGFALKLNGRTQTIEYGTYLPMSPKDLTVDRAGTIAIVGDSAGSEADSLVRNGFQLSSKGGQEAFICRLDPRRAGMDSLLFGSYLGGQADDAANAIAVDAGGMIYVSGQTLSRDFPTTPANRIAATGGNFLVKVNPAKSDAASLLWATQLGAAGVTRLTVDAIGNAFITGTTYGGLFVTPGALQPEPPGGSCLSIRCGCDLVMGFCPARCGYITTPAPCSDAFVAKISGDGSAVLYSTYLGSAADQTPEGANDIALDQAGNIYLTGYGKLPVTTGAFQLDGATGFLAKVTLDSRSTAVASVSAASFAGPQLAPESLAVGFLDAFGAGADKLNVAVRDSVGMERSCAVLFSGFGQINFQIPPGTANGDARVKVTSNGVAIATGALQIAKVAPGVFAANANGRGVAAAVALRVKPDNSQVHETIARYDPSLKQFVSIPIDLGPEGDQMILSLFGTGWRFRSSESAVKVAIGGVDAPVTYAGLQPTLTGLDQINVRLPRTLIGRGEVDVAVTVDGKTANTVRVSFK